LNTEFFRRRNTKLIFDLINPGELADFLDGSPLPTGIANIVVVEGTLALQQQP